MNSRFLVHYSATGGFSSRHSAANYNIYAEVQTLLPDVSRYNAEAFYAFFLCHLSILRKMRKTWRTKPQPLDPAAVALFWFVSSCWCCEAPILARVAKTAASGKPRVYPLPSVADAVKEARSNFTDTRQVCNTDCCWVHEGQRTTDTVATKFIRIWFGAPYVYIAAVNVLPGTFDGHSRCIRRPWWHLFCRRLK